MHTEERENHKIKVEKKQVNSGRKKQLRKVLGETDDE